jgi:hypothetical protein
VPNGKNKILYMVQNNNNWDGNLHGDVYINKIKADRFRDTFGNNPFANHFRSRIYQTYLATTISSSWIN